MEHTRPSRVLALHLSVFSLPEAADEAPASQTRAGRWGGGGHWEGPGWEAPATPGWGRCGYRHRPEGPAVGRLEKWPVGELGTSSSKGGERWDRAFQWGTPGGWFPEF